MPKSTLQRLEKYSRYVVNDEEGTKKVRAELKKFFLSSGLTYPEIAAKLGYKIQSVRNTVSVGKFGKKRALAYSKAFGFNPEFLMTGKGFLFERQTVYRKIVRENENLRTLVQVQKAIIERQSKEIQRLEDALRQATGSERPAAE